MQFDDFVYRSVQHRSVTNPISMKTRRDMYLLSINPIHKHLTYINIFDYFLGYHLTYSCFFTIRILAQLVAIHQIHKVH